ncbi:MAG: hypothetical protein FWG84_07465 [Bacteroidales bacterium]|nr:hypothetical protein [Bacteroidales bacterium]
MISLKAFFSTIPYDAITKEHRDEQYYQHVFYLLFRMKKKAKWEATARAVSHKRGCIPALSPIFEYES